MLCTVNAHSRSYIGLPRAVDMAYLGQYKVGLGLPYNTTTQVIQESEKYKDYVLYGSRC